MSRIDYQRLDTAVTIAPALARGQVVITGPAGQTATVPIGPLPQAERRRLCPRPPDEAWAAGSFEPIRRLTLDIRGAALQVHPWEDWLLPQTGGPLFDSVVRLSRVPPRVAQAIFAPPLRVALADHPAPDAALAEIRSLLPADGARVALAYAGAAVALRRGADAGRPPQGWPVVDVLHLATFPLAATAAAQLSPDAAVQGSLGWLSRLLAGWQTRLVIIDVAAGPPTARARALAAALVARGGPAVLVRDRTEPLWPLYERLIHDIAIDAFMLERLRLGNRPLPRIAALFLGAGREELMRLSAPAAALERLRFDLIASRRRDLPPRDLGASRAPRRAGAVSRLLRGFDASRRAEQALDDVVEQYRGWQFNFRESDGLLPMAEALTAAAEATEPLVRASRVRARRVKPRYLNAGLWQPGPQGRQRVAPRDAQLIRDAPYELGLQIGARDRLIPVYETSAFREIPRMPGAKGVWLEVAVNAVGFEIEGDPVQDLWVPHDEPTDQLWFALRPVRTGVAVLRCTLYHQQNVVQSYRLAALVGTDGPHGLQSPFDTDDEARRQLARALQASADRMPSRATYVTRLEYESVPVADAAQLPERQLAIVANEIGSERVITVKGRSCFFDSQPGVVNALVDAARNELFEISVEKLTPAREDWLCRFGTNTQVNEASLRATLPRLALAGWRMYNDVFAAPHRALLRDTLADGEAKISVAHALLADVLPWGLIYDRPYTDKPVPGGRLEVCTAALPDAKGELTVHTCGAAPNCVLHQGLAEKNVACPLHFWGFRHQIEIPPKQVEDGLAPATTPGSGPMDGADPRLAAVFNVGLHTAAAHQGQLQALKLAGDRTVRWQVLETHADRVLQVLDDPELDLVYLYCHARGGLGDPDRTAPPKLEFGDPATGVLQYACDEIQVQWRRGPLVFVNGCSTAAFSPDALSPFVKTFTRDCGARGVVGTEIPVHEDVATDFAARLIPRVLDGEFVGQAMLAVRRELLARYNPLGLAYTLYAFSELRIVKA